MPLYPYNIHCHMRNSVTYLALRCMLGYIDVSQLHHNCHLMTLGIQVHSVIILA